MDYNFYFCWTEHLRFILDLLSLFDIKEEKEHSIKIVKIFFSQKFREINALSTF